MVGFQVIGADTVIMLAAQAGQMELNVMMPVIAYNLLFALEILKNCIHTFASSCVSGITANAERCDRYLEESVGLVTVLAPYVGYHAAAEMAQESMQSGRSIREIILARALLSPEKLAEILDPFPLTNPGVPGMKNE
jgi:aspartate ammonia-lyase